MYASIPGQFTKADLQDDDRCDKTGFKSCLGTGFRCEISTNSFYTQTSQPNKEKKNCYTYYFNIQSETIFNNQLG